MRSFIFCLFLFATLMPARGEAVYFVSFAWIKPDHLGQYEAFLRSVNPIWQRHKMKVLTRAKVVHVLAGDEQAQPPDEIALIQAASMEDFRSYIADPDFQSIKQMREDSVDQMLVLEGYVRREPKYDFIKSLPKLAFVIESFSSAQETALIDIGITVRGTIKGQLSPPLSESQFVTLYPLPLDDNPMSFLDALSDGAQVYVVASHTQ